MKLMDFLFPPKCILCNRLLLREEQEFCQECAKEQPEYPYGKDKPNPNKRVRHVSAFTAVWYYEGMVRKSILGYKFYRRKNLAQKYGVRMAERLRAHGMENFDVLTWVPVSTIRKLERSYDQSELLAEIISRELGIASVRCLRKRHTRRQSGLQNEAARAANVAGAFRAVNPEQFRGKRILLVDDILTTGATMQECARTLLTAGAAEVNGVCIAAARKEKKKTQPRKKEFSYS